MAKLVFLMALSVGVLAQLPAKSPVFTTPSTVTITSNKASCQQHTTDKKLFTFTYLDNVNVQFSDGTQASSDKLVVEIDTTKSAPPAKKDADQIKSITLSERVSFSQKERSAKADQAVFYPQKKQCLLSGNVSIVQKQVDQKSIPMHINCSKAAIDLTSGSIRLLGTDEKPVSTTLVLNKKTSTPSPQRSSPTDAKNQTSTAC